MACILINRSISDLNTLLVLIAAGVVSAVSMYWRFFAQWLSGIRARDWATVSAVIDVVSVAPNIVQNRWGEDTVGYLGTLTYFYRNPELQMGEFTRSFTTEEEAQHWTAPYKGKEVMVHVDPRDPSNSVLRKEGL
jgi:hypothetical protein